MSNIPKSVPNKYRERIAHWDDEREIGNSLIVSLKDGWKFLDVECHTKGFDTVRDAIDGLRETLPCDCAGCRKVLAAEVLAWRARFPEYEHRPQDECVALKLKQEKR